MVDVNKGAAVRRTVEERLKILLDALIAEIVRLLDYLDVEYFEDIIDDPRFEEINKLMSLYVLLSREPDNPDLEHVFDDMEGKRKWPPVGRAWAQALALARDHN